MSVSFHFNSICLSTFHQVQYNKNALTSASVDDPATKAHGTTNGTNHVENGDAEHDDSEDDDEVEGAPDAGTGDGAKKKKKRKPKKKKKKTGAATATAQTSPPRVLIDNL